MDAAILSFQRLGWTRLRPFKNKLDNGSVVHLTSSPPALLKFFVNEALQRIMVGVPAKNLRKAGFVSQRFGVDHAKAPLATKALPDKIKHVAFTDLRSGRVCSSRRGRPDA